MNILFWADGFWPRIGGTETQGWQFVQEMQKRGHSCIVLCQKDGPTIADQEVHEGVMIWRFDFDAIIKRRELKVVGPLRKALEKIKNEFRPSVIYLNTLHNGSAFAFLLFRRLFSAQTVLTVHAPYFGNTIPKFLLKICLKVDHICLASDWGYKEMIRVFPSFHEKMQVIYCGISPPKIEPTKLPFNPATILLLGRLSFEKGFEIGIEAFALLRKKRDDIRLLIAGEGDERPFLESLTLQFGIEDCVEFTGGFARDSEAVFSLINRSTFVVIPSHFETFGLVALETMRMGRAVIASDVGGLPEIVSNGKTGLLVPPANVKAFCSAIQTLLENQEMTCQMGQQARKWAMHRYLLKENVDQYEKLFSSFHSYGRL